METPSKEVIELTDADLRATPVEDDEDDLGSEAEGPAPVSLMKFMMDRKAKA